MKRIKYLAWMKTIMMDEEERYSLVDSFGSVVLHNVLIAFSESLL